jgi:hypothetical protein
LVNGELARAATICPAAALTRTKKGDGIMGSSDTGKSKSGRSGKGGGGASTPAYGMGVIGALVYFVPEADSILEVLWGIVLSMFWPAVLVYHALDAMVGSF